MQRRLKIRLVIVAAAALLVALAAFILYLVNAGVLVGEWKT